MDIELLKILTEHINRACKLSLPELVATPVQGGDICRSYRLYDKQERHVFFVKTQQQEFLDVFKCEYNNLVEIANSNTILSPKTIAYGKDNNTSFLILEYLNFSNENNDALLGKQLARLHRNTHSQFGFFENNFIGTTPQHNQYSNNWAEFWIEQRLQTQLQLAYKNGFAEQLQATEKLLIESCARLLEVHKPSPSLVHGDLWGGNKAFLSKDKPVIFDPACYYGDREVDIAMTQLFGGFNKAFYSAYNQEWPLGSNYQQRAILYNLYHQLNHLNLFGSIYLQSCLSAINTLTRGN